MSETRASRIATETMAVFSRLVRDLPPKVWLEACEELATILEAEIDCARQDVAEEDS